MITPLPCEYILDRSAELLGPGWLRRRKSLSDWNEQPGPGVWRTGPDGRFKAAMIGALDNADDVALVCVFLFADEDIADALLRAAERGVRVYVLTASEQRVGKSLHDDDEFGHGMAEAHKRLLDRLAGKVLLRTAEHFHAKFMVTDPQDFAQAKGFISTANFNKALCENIELGVEVKGLDAQDLAACFNWAFWCEADRELVEKGRLLTVAAPPARPEQPHAKRVVATLRASQTLRDTVLSLIRQADQEILLTTYGMELEHEVVRSLIKAAEKGVKVTVLTRPRPKTSNAVTALATAGALIYGHDKLHAKLIIVDDNAIVLSANIESSGLDRGFEVGVMLSSEMARVVKATIREWVRDFPWVFRIDAMLGEHLGDFLPADKSLHDGVLRVVLRHEQTCPDQVAGDALQLHNAPRPKLNPTLNPRELPQQIVFSWVAVPPRLPKNAKERLQPKSAGVGDNVKSAPPVYDHAGKTYILLKDQLSIEAAKAASENLGGIVVVP